MEVHLLNINVFVTLCFTFMFSIWEVGKIFYRNKTVWFLANKL